MVRVLLVAMTLLLAGCSGGATKGTLEDAAGPQGEPGRLCLVVVDEAIRPIAGVLVQVAGAGTNQTGTSNENGVVCFDVPDGSYVAQGRHGLYATVQTSIDFAKDNPPQVTKLQMTRLFSQDPYRESRQVDGFIQCGYSISGVMSSLCLNDYTHFVGPYTCEDCEHLLDRRSADFEVDAGWQTMIFEMTWEPTQQATSDEMTLTVSHFPRSASHWYCQGSGGTPVLVRMEVGVVCDRQQSEPELVPPEGLPNMHLFASTSASNQPASLILSQSFTVYLNFFYYGAPPEGWSFVAGHPSPF